MLVHCGITEMYLLMTYMPGPFVKFRHASFDQIYMWAIWLSFACVFKCNFYPLYHMHIDIPGLQIGQQQHFNLGQYFRSRYINFTGPKYDPDQVNRALSFAASIPIPCVLGTQISL